MIVSYMIFTSIPQLMSDQRDPRVLGCHKDCAWFTESTKERKNAKENYFLMFECLMKNVKKKKSNMHKII